MKECIDNCLNCFQLCEEAFVKALKDEFKTDSQQLLVLKSCAEICQTSARFMIMESPFHHLTCGVCSEICHKCADVCEELGTSTLSQCADACRRCADSCGEMSQMSH